MTTENMFNETVESMSSYPSTTVEHFWGRELTKENPSVTWSFKEEDDDFDYIQHILFLKGAVLGASANEGERNIVQISTTNFEKKSIQQALFSLTLGVNDMCNLDHSFTHSNEMTLTLTHGNGPVCLSAQHCIELPLDDSDVTEDDKYTETDEDPLSEADKPQSKKRKAATTLEKSKKKKVSVKEVKKEKASESDDDENEESMEVQKSDEKSEGDEDESEEEEEKTPEKPQKKKGKQQKSQTNRSSKKPKNRK